MRDALAAADHPDDRHGSVCRITRRPSATFVVLEPMSGAIPRTGFHSGELELAGVRAPCAIRVLVDDDAALWCQLRGPLPNGGDGETVVLRLVSSGDGDRTSGSI